MDFARRVQAAVIWCHPNLAWTFIISPRVGASEPVGTFRTEARKMVGVISIPDGDLRTLLAMGGIFPGWSTRTSMTLSHELNQLSDPPLPDFHG